MKVVLLETSRRQLKGTLVREIAVKKISTPGQISFNQYNSLLGETPSEKRFSFLLRHTYGLGLFLRVGTSAATHRETLSILNDPNLKRINVSDWLPSSRTRVISSRNTCKCYRRFIAAVPSEATPRSVTFPQLFPSGESTACCGLGTIWAITASRWHVTEGRFPYQWRLIQITTSVSAKGNLSPNYHVSWDFSFKKKGAPD